MQTALGMAGGTRDSYHHRQSTRSSVIRLTVLIVPLSSALSTRRGPPTAIDSPPSSR